MIRSFVGRMWVLSLVVVMLAATVLVVVPSAARASPAIASHAPAYSAVGTGTPPRAPTGMPSMDPAMQKLLDGVREPRTYWNKMTPSVQDAALAGTGTFHAAILTDDVNALGAFLRSAGVDTKYGSVATTKTGPRVVTIDLPARLLEKTAALDRVFTIAPAVLPSAPDRVDPDVPSANALNGGPAPNLIEAGKGHHVPEAWALGYTGYGVNVAPMDSGTDFGHPDLQGTFARDPDSLSPYYNWPIAFDPNSMASYLLGGATFPVATNSWYVNTSFSATANPITHNLTAPFNGHTYNVGTIVSASGTYHLGLHPDNTLRSFYYGEYVALLLTDSTTPGAYDTVYIDLDDNYQFGNDKPADVSSPEIWADFYNAATDTWDYSSYTSGDGLADLSGGLVYFIADGSNVIPYSDVIGSVYGLPVPTPGNGELVALQIGDVFAVGGGDHGTLVASSIVAQNKTGKVLGFAPNARVVSVGNIYAGGFFFDIFPFVGEGYDAIPGTGDEAQVASASFGFSSIFNDGWDFNSRWVEYWSLVYGATSFAVSSGNGGHGFGTVTSPSSSSGVISVGASTSYNAALKTFEDAAHSTFGDIQPWSNRGPSAIGTSKPDIVTIGAWASGDGALNSFGGAPPWFVWGGTSLSAPAAAGILALAVNAWQNATGGLIFNQYAKAILVDAADNIHYDGQVMGHGLTNAYRAVLAASFTDGIAAYHLTSSGLSPEWMAGDYRGTAYPSFTNILAPGASRTDSFWVDNLNIGTPKSLTVSDWQLRKIGSGTWTIVTANSAESPPNFVRPDYLIDLTSLVPAGTNLVKATVSFPLAQLDPDGNYLANSRWRVLLYDWSDYDGNGTYWMDANANGVVNTGELDKLSGTELQRFTYGYPTGTNLEVFVHDPIARVHDGFLLGIQHRTVSSLVLSTTLTVTVDYYQAVDAPWLDESVSSLALPAGGSDTVDLTVTLPPGQPYGVLSAVVTLTDDVSGAETQIPVVVQVAAASTSFSFGGDPTSTAFLDNNRMFGGVDWDWRADAGDWRFFYTDIPDSTPIALSENLIVHTRWAAAPKTDIDTLIFGPALDEFSFFYPDIWGPYSMTTVGASANQLISAGRWRFQTASGGPEEWVAAPLSHGLHEIALHNVLSGGTGPSDLFSGEVGTFSLAPNPWFVITSNATGKGTFNASSSLTLPGLSVLAYGVSPPNFKPSLPITDGGAYTETFTAAAVGFMDIAIDESFPQGMDIDLYLYRWTGSTYSLVASSAGPTAFEEIQLTRPLSGDYLILVDGYSVPTGSGAFDLYSLVVQGTQLTPKNVPSTTIPAGTPVRFNVTWNFAGNGPGFYQGVLFVGPAGAPAIRLDTFFLLYDNNAPVVLSTDPSDGSSTNFIPPQISVSYVDPEISAGIVFVSFVIDGFNLSFFGTFNDTDFVWSTPFALSDGVHTANVTVYDGAGFSTWFAWTFTVDTVGPPLSVTSPGYALTRTASTTVSGMTESGAAVTVNGASATVGPSGAFSKTITLAEGPNTITVVATDAAGNAATVIRAVTLDTVPPTLTVSSPAAGSRSTSNRVTVTGTTEAGAQVWVNGVRAGVGPSGSWSVDISLPDGPQAITTIAQDGAGNSAQDARAIDVGPAPDTTAPVVTVTTPSDGTTTDQSTVLVTGTVDDADATVLVNGVEVHPATDGTWSVSVALVPGANVIAVSAVDAAGNRATTLSRTITYTSPIPGINQAAQSLGGNLILGIALVFIALAVLMFLVYSNLNRKIGGMKPKPPGEGGGT